MSPMQGIVPKVPQGVDTLIPNAKGEGDGDGGHGGYAYPYPYPYHSTHPHPHPYPAQTQTEGEERNLRDRTSSLLDKIKDILG